MLTKIVTITVTKAGIIAQPDPVRVPRKKRNVLIRWRIETRGWKFAPHGITIKKNYNQFHSRRRHEGARAFHWFDRNTKKEYYKYTVNVTNGRTTASRDPGIGNGGQK